MRLFPGYGDLPLADIVTALPPGLSVSLRCPNLPLLERLGPGEFANRAYRALEHLLATETGYLTR